MSGKVYVTPELQAYRKHFSELAVAVRDPEWLASELFSEGMISHEALDDTVTAIGVSCTNKARKLLCHFKGKLADHPEYFQQFLAILRKERPFHWLVNRIEATHSKLYKACTQNHSN